MISNPIFKLNNSGLIIPGPWYSLTYDTNNSGSVTSIAGIGKQGDTTILSALPNHGYKLSAFDCDYGTITDNNVYHFTNRDATISAYFEIDEGPVPSALPLSQHGGEYGWDIPLEWISGGTLSAYISAQSNNYSQDSWEGGFYMARMDDTSEYRRMDLDFSAIGDGKFEIYIEPSNFTEWTYACESWHDSYGDISGFVHPAAFQPYNFDGEPYGLFVTGVTI